MVPVYFLSPKQDEWICLSITKIYEHNAFHHHSKKVNCKTVIKSMSHNFANNFHVPQNDFWKKKTSYLFRRKCHNLVEAALTPHTTREADVLSHKIMATVHYIKLRDSISSFTVLRGKCCWKSINFITLTAAASLFLSLEPSKALCFFRVFWRELCLPFSLYRVFTPS